MDCHVPNTAVIGLFKIVSESGIGAGTRRIEAVTGAAAYKLMADQIDTLKEAAAKLKTNSKDVLLVLMQYLQKQKNCNVKTIV